MSVHDLDRHRALVRASREIPDPDRFDWDAAPPPDWLTPSAPAADRGLTLPGLALGTLGLLAAFILGLALLGLATAWRWAAALFGLAL